MKKAFTEKKMRTVFVILLYASFSIEISVDDGQGIKLNTIRLSIGTENVKDLIAALDTAFKAVQKD